MTMLHSGTGRNVSKLHVGIVAPGDDWPTRKINEHGDTEPVTSVHTEIDPEGFLHVWWTEREWTGG